MKFQERHVVVRIGAACDHRVVRVRSTGRIAPATRADTVRHRAFEGGNQAQLVHRRAEMVASGVRVMCLLALNDSGTPSFDAGLAKKQANLGIPCFACTPGRLPELLEGALRGAVLVALAGRVAGATKQS